MTQIVAIGGGGFSTNSEPGLDTYVLNQANKPTPKIGFIGTASGDDEGYLLKFYTRFSRLNCIPSHLPLFRRTPKVSDWVATQDIIFVGGGNTKSLLAVWETWELPALLSEAMFNGTILSGISAGAICWFESGLTDASGGALLPLECLGFLEGSCSPHYSLEEDRKPAFETFISSGEMPSGVAIDDGAAVHFIDGTPARIVSATHGSSAHAIFLSSGKVISEPIRNVQLIDVSAL